MKQPASTLNTRSKVYMASFFLLVVFLIGCRKFDPGFPGSGPQASTYSADVIDKWMTLQLRLMRDATGIPNVAFSRYYAYSGIAALESLKPGLGSFIPELNLNGLSGLPQVDARKKYFWPASVNSALALMNRSIFTAASVADKAAIDSLETALNSSFSSQPSDVLSRSNDFGTAAGTAVFDWSETDGYLNASKPYTLPVGPGLWVPTPPAFAAASTPYWGNNRSIISGSLANSQPADPTAYSEDPASPFFKMVKQLYDISQQLTDDQKNQAIFWRDVPGVTSPGHWLSILQQVLKTTNSRLDKAAYSYALTGTCLSDACISCWQTKYRYNLVRPITYLQTVMGFPTWTAVLSTPAHPEYSSAHAVLSSATADAFTYLFGNIGSFTDHTYDYLSMPARTYNSFRAIGEDAAHSRVFAGIHYVPTVEAGLVQGRIVTANILAGLGTGKEVAKY
jgi:hypothetical protein